MRGVGYARVGYARVYCSPEPYIERVATWRFPVFWSRDCMGAILSPTARGQYPPTDVFLYFRVTYGRYAGVLRLGLYQPK